MNKLKKMQEYYKNKLMKDLFYQINNTIRN